MGKRIEQDAFHEGWLAHKSGADCPFISGTTQAEAWSRGYEDRKSLTEPSVLRPCPFCGAPADPEGWSSIDRKGPACTNGDCDGAAESAEAWNRRVPDAEMLKALQLIHGHLFGPTTPVPRHEIDDLCRAVFAKAKS